MRRYFVKEIYFYPIKSCRGISVEEANVSVIGIDHDREYMVVDAETGMSVSQSADHGQRIGIKSMSLIQPSIEEDSIMRVRAPWMSNLEFDMVSWLDMFTDRGGEYKFRAVPIWEENQNVVVMPEEVNEWFTEFLSHERPGKYQLVYFDPEVIRRAKTGYSQIRFHDQYPFVMTSQESLDDLNTRIEGEEVLMNRFRPNIVISGGVVPYREDRFDRVVINRVDLENQGAHHCSPSININQQTGESGEEPLRTLATYKLVTSGDEKVTFGSSYNHLSMGQFHVGDEVKIVRYGV